MYLGKARAYYLQAADTRANSLKLQTFPVFVSQLDVLALLKETLTTA